MATTNAIHAPVAVCYANIMNSENFEMQNSSASLGSNNFPLRLKFKIRLGSNILRHSLSGSASQ